MKVDKRGKPGVRWSNNVVGVGIGRSASPEVGQGEPVLTILVKNKAEAEQVDACCPAMKGLMKSRVTEILEVGNIVALPK